MKGDSYKLINESSLTYVSLNKSEIENSYLEKGEDSEYSSFQILIKEILKEYNKIKELRKNFFLDEYEKLTKEIRNNIRIIRKQYFSQEKKEINDNKITMKDNSTKQNSNTIRSDEKTNIYSGNNTNLNQDNRLNSIKINNNIYLKLNESSFIQENKMVFNNINEPKNINGIYNILLEIVSFLLCYDDIYINYENKSAYFTLKLLLQISTLHFIKKIEKQDFLLMIINKICNILCNYNNKLHKDESIKKILVLDEKEVNKIKDLFNYDSQFINKIQKKLRNEINKLDLSYKVEKIKEEKILDKLLFKEKELELDFKNNIHYKFNKLNLENEILENIQNDLDDTHKMFLKEPIKKEFEIFNLLINKLSKYEAPLIKKKFLEIIIRNKDIFNYINENIILKNIPENVIKRYNIYPFNKNLSVFIDKKIICGKIILDILSIPLEQDYFKIVNDLETFGNKFLEKLFENTSFKLEFNLIHYHLILFAYMINSDIPQKDLYFNRISALITSNADISDIYDILDETENINIYKENKNSNIILFDFWNTNKNKISFLLEKKMNDKEETKKKCSNLELCSILSKSIFNNDSIYIILTIALKYWGIKRKIFKYDYTKRKGESPILDDTILLYFIYYFLIHKDKIDCLKNKMIKKMIKKRNMKKKKKKKIK